MKRLAYLLLVFITLTNSNRASADVKVELGSLEPGETITYRYRVRVNSSSELPAGVRSISSQGTVSSNGERISTTDDPDINGQNNPTITNLAIVDSDGDGILDDLDGCPFSPTKNDPGSCGCNSEDSDTNANGIADCLTNSDLKNLLESIDVIVKKMRPNSKLKKKKARKKQRLRKKDFKALKASIDQIFSTSVASLTTTSSDIDLNKLYKNLNRKLKKALKTGNKKFLRFKKLARKIITKVNNAI